MMLNKHSPSEVKIFATNKSPILVRPMMLSTKKNSKLMKIHTQPPLHAMFHTILSPSNLPISQIHSNAGHQHINKNTHGAQYITQSYHFSPFLKNPPKINLFKPHYHLTSDDYGWIQCNSSDLAGR